MKRSCKRQPVSVSVGYSTSRIHMSRIFSFKLIGVIASLCAIAFVSTREIADVWHPDFLVDSGRSVKLTGTDPKSIENIIDSTAIRPDWAISPFGKGAPVIKDAQLRAAERRLTMEKNGYGTPLHYYEMPVKQLKDLAKNKDVFALLQLSEQYWSENLALEQDPDYDFGRYHKDVANEYLAEAVAAGHIHAAIILAARFGSDHNPSEAYVWTLVAGRLGELSGDALSRQATSHLTQQQIQDAQGKAQRIYADVFANLVARTKGAGTSLK